MKTTIEISGESYMVDLDSGLDISLGISTDGSTSCFGAQPPIYEPMSGEGWTAKVSEGGSVNAMEVSFNPHAHGTHTECLGHISVEHHKLEEMKVGSHFVCKLISVSLDHDHKQITEELIQAEWGEDFGESALVIRTLPNSAEKKGKDYTNTDPAFVDPGAIEWIIGKGIDHLLIDLPSVDPESDGGELKAHKTFWNWPTYEGRHRATITELVLVDDSIKDGLYLLNLQRASFHLDCAPSRPILYALHPRTTTK